MSRNINNSKASNSKKAAKIASAPVVETSSQFYETKLRFRDFADYERPLTYEEWMEVPDECKAAVLYVQFYNEITLAWYKTKRSHVDTYEGVSEILLYLNKNVEKIKNDPKRFNPRYIYKVAWNCLSCLCWTDADYSRRYRIFENECSNIIGYGEDELNLFDTIIEDEEVREKKFDTDGSIRNLANATMIWDVIEDMGQKAKYVVAKLLGEKSYPPKELNSVSEEETEEIIEELKVRLAKFAGAFC